MRRPFLVAFLATAALLSLVKWWVGLAFVGYLGLRYVMAKLSLWP
jgi:hypothetical protein